jgi:hypothetical protein
MDLPILEVCRPGKGVVLTRYRGGRGAADRRVVVNPEQARALLAAVRRQKPSGPALVAFVGAMYFAALRPAEAWVGWAIRPLIGTVASMCAGASVTRPRRSR